MTIASCVDILFDQFKDLRSAALQVEDTLMNDLVRLAKDCDLRRVLAGHLSATRIHLLEIHGVFEAHSKDPGEDRCKAMAGLIEGGNRHLAMAADATVRDVLLVAHTNRIAAYLAAAAEVTAGVAKSCGMGSEADVAGAVLAYEHEFKGELGDVGSRVY